MTAPASLRASALAAALSITAVVIVALAEIGHPPPEGVGLIASLVLPHRQEGASSPPDLFIDPNTLVAQAAPRP